MYNILALYISFGCPVVLSSVGWLVIFKLHELSSITDGPRNEYRTVNYLVDAGFSKIFFLFIDRILIGYYMKYMTQVVCHWPTLSGGVMFPPESEFLTGNKYHIIIFTRKIGIFFKFDQHFSLKTAVSDHLILVTFWLIYVVLF